ncbi:hypothetical protein [Azospirillum sp. Sh1]|uniref:hypothetical protein n=1 Tax=Azospirillum sp. Sh1 TaxID=2607285 RepID=UPI0011EC13AF|nr:hypothetical protein [Azospirillum sp. Sh1]KAA0570483.1 hypothetical protein FZ029_30175 [Azospirillum sp. Sh1]
MSTAPPTAKPLSYAPSVENPGSEKARIFGELAESYPAILRLSTTPGDVLPDSVSTPRGLAVKVLGVSGHRMPGSEDEATQDFVMANAPVFSAPDARQFLKTLKLLAATTDRAETAKKVLSAGLRARRLADDRSAEFRMERNGCPMHEPAAGYRLPG